MSVSEEARSGNDSQTAASPRPHPSMDDDLEKLDPWSTLYAFCVIPHVSSRQLSRSERIFKQFLIYIWGGERLDYLLRFEGFLKLFSCLLLVF